jgi:hypothetical protein
MQALFVFGFGTIATSACLAAAADIQRAGLVKTDRDFDFVDDSVNHRDSS